MKFELPAPAEWNEVEKDYPTEELQIQPNDFDFILITGGLDRFADDVSLSSWINYLSSRMIQTRWSWVIMMYTYKKGIPDDKYFKAGQKGGLEYWPDFEKNDRLLKAQFDYFSDVFFFKFYSCLDTIGCILNIIYDLELPRQNLFLAAKKLNVRPQLQLKLKKIVKSPEFNAIRLLRNSITHLKAPGDIGSPVTKVSEGFFTVGAGEYTNSKTIITEAETAVRILVDVMRVIREEIGKEIRTPHVI
jgi:Cthe_2314-like HEPN